MQVDIDENKAVDWTARNVLYAAIIATFLTSYVALVLGMLLESQWLSACGAMVFDALVLDGRALQGQLWRYFTHVFLHGNVLHIFFNMLVINVFFKVLRARFSNLRWLIIFFCSGIAGGAAHMLLTPELAVVGASGGALGLWGAALALALRMQFMPEAKRPWDSTRVLKSLGFMLLLNVVLWTFIPNIAHGAHLGGFVCGAILGAIMPFALIPQFIQSRPLALMIAVNRKPENENRPVASVMIPPSFDPGRDFLLRQSRMISVTGRETVAAEILIGPESATVKDCLESPTATPVVIHNLI